MPKKSKTLCLYGCGREAEGELFVMFDRFKESGETVAEAEFSATIPACALCAMSNIKLQVTIPKEPE